MVTDPCLAGDPISYPPENAETLLFFVVFSEGIKWEYWPEMG